MNWIERFFVRAKHWQIFLLLVGVFVALDILFRGGFMLGSPSPEQSTINILLVGTLAALSGWCFLLWLWFLGSYLNSLAPAPLRRKLGFLFFTIFYSAVYIFASIALFFSLNPKLTLFTIPLHLLALFCMYSNLYFVAESLKIAETGISASFFDCLGPFLLLWFYPVGIWFIQPRVNHLYAAHQNGELRRGMAEI